MNHSFLSRLFRFWRKNLAAMFTFPWPRSKMPEKIAGYKYDREDHLFNWWYAWILSFAGIIGIGFYAPYLVEKVLLPQWKILSGYEDFLVIGFAFVGGVLWQFLFITLSTIARSAFRATIIFIMISLLAFLSPFALTAWLVYWYITHFAPNHNLVGTGILGATVLKIAIAFLPGIIKSIVTGSLFAWILNKLRGHKPPSSNS